MNDIYKKTSVMIKEHLSRRDLSKTESNWVISKSKVGGRGVFAKKNLDVGEIIFVDYPLILGPRAIAERICTVCYQTEHLLTCGNGCGLYLCSEDCKASDLHRLDCAKINSWKGDEPDLTGIQLCLTPIRSLFLSDFERKLVKILMGHKAGMHGKEVDLLKEKFKLGLSREEEEFMRVVCSVLDANAFEVATQNSKSLRGLYPLSSLLNHDCSPNVMHVFDDQQYMIVKASKPIEKGEEIFNCYSRTIWATLSRRLHLLTTKNFACACPRCEDKTEFCTNLNAISCKNCKGILLPNSPLKFNTDWTCSSCNSALNQSNVRFILSVLANRLSELTGENFAEALEFYRRKMLGMVPDFSQASVCFKYAVIWFLGYNEGFMLNEISDEHLILKENCCREILTLVQKLRLGACKLRGLILLELYKTRRERNERRNKHSQISRRFEINNNVLEEDEMLEECTKILLFDVTAAKDLQTFWRTRNIDTNWRNYL